MKHFHFQIIATIILVALCGIDFATGNIAKHRSKQLSRSVKRGKRNNPDPLSAHVIDISTGKSAEGVKVTLSWLDDAGQWRNITEQITGADGRVVKDRNTVIEKEFIAGTYKMSFYVGPYYQALGKNAFYPYIDVIFLVENPDQHYHIPIVLSPYGYSTYRGS